MLRSRRLRRKIRSKEAQLSVSKTKDCICNKGSPQANFCECNKTNNASCLNISMPIFSGRTFASDAKLTTDLRNQLALPSELNSTRNDTQIISGILFCLIDFLYKNSLS